MLPIFRNAMRPAFLLNTLSAALALALVINLARRYRPQQALRIAGRATLLADRLTAQGLTDQEVLDRIIADVKAEIDTGVQFALAAGYPAGSQVDEDVYA